MIVCIVDNKITKLITRHYIVNMDVYILWLSHYKDQYWRERRMGVVTVVGNSDTFSIEIKCTIRGLWRRFINPKIMRHEINF